MHNESFQSATPPALPQVSAFPTRKRQTGVPRQQGQLLNWKRPDFQLWKACDLDLGWGHTAYCRASLIYLYLLAKFHRNQRNFLWTDRCTHASTYVWTDGWTFATGFIRSTLCHLKKRKPISISWCLKTISILIPTWKKWPNNEKRYRL